VNLKTHIGNRVKMARKAARLTQRQLAETMGKAVETISNVERGRTYIGLETLEQIADALKVPVTSIFEGYRAGLRVSPGRFELQARLAGAADKLSDDELRVAIRLVTALRGCVASSDDPSESDGGLEPLC
jgi:transcriptional regulator with XRE-family HTH domain